MLPTAYVEFDRVATYRKVLYSALIIAVEMMAFLLAIRTYSDAIIHVYGGFYSLVILIVI